MTIRSLDPGMGTWRGLQDLTRVAPGRRNAAKAPGTQNETGRDAVAADLRFRISTPIASPAPYPAAPTAPRTPDLARYAPPVSGDAQPRTVLPEPIAGAPSPGSPLGATHMPTPAAPEAPPAAAAPATPSVWLPMQPVDAAPSGPVSITNGDGLFAQPQPQPAAPEFWSGETPSTGGGNEKSPWPVAFMRAPSGSRG